MKFSVAIALALLAACGDDGGHATLDAGQADSPAADGPPTMPGCDYVEQHDATNDDVPPAMGTPEASGLTLATHAVICGSFDSSHFDGDITVDVDGYTIAVGADTDVLVRISGAGAEAIELVGVDIYGGSAFDQHLGAVTFYGDHGVTAVHLPAGTYELIPFALNSEAITSSVAYKLEVEKDNPTARCAELTTGGYAEAHDGATNNGNDVIAFPSGMPAALTTSAADMPEPSAISLVPTGSARITGSAADIVTADRYEDRDTYAFATAAGTNEVTTHLTWTGAANLDFYVFEAGSVEARVLATGATAGREDAMFTLKPSTNYWLVVGAKAQSTGLPAAYSATLCGASYTP